jgi:outer membrane immunogenic protein
MTTRSFVVGAVLSTSVLTGSAMAADMPTKAPPAVRAACAHFGGLYVGGQAGISSYGHTFNDLDSFGGNQIDDDLPKDLSHTGRGWLAGAQAGYNWQSNCAVFGIETDWAWTNTKASSFLSDGEGFPPSENDNMTVTSKLHWFGTTRIRTGVVVDSLLLYVTGGLAYANLKRNLSFIESDGPRPTEVFSSRRTRLGWTAGVGTEWAINANWSLKSEFLYMQFQSDETTATSATISEGTQTRFKHEDSAWIGRIGLNYRFDAPY